MVLTSEKKEKKKKRYLMVLFGFNLGWKILGKHKSKETEKTCINDWFNHFGCINCFSGNHECYVAIESYTMFIPSSDFETRHLCYYYLLFLAFLFLVASKFRCPKFYRTILSLISPATRSQVSKFVNSNLSNNQISTK